MKYLGIELLSKKKTRKYSGDMADVVCLALSFDRNVFILKSLKFHW